jgi:zinc transport system substrate-binding protein
MRSRLPRARLTGLVGAAAVVGLVGGCSAATAETEPGQAGDRLQVVASFYPLEYAAQQVGGDRVSVVSLTKPGVEPHDLELTAKAVGRIAGADLVVYAKGFQPAVDTAVEQEGAGHALDVTPMANLDLLAPPVDDGHGDPGHTHTEAEEPSDEIGGARDPHFWLDPERYAAVATAIADRLGHVDTAHAAEYSANAQAFAGRLAALDGELHTGLASCTNTDLVTSHAAFGYLSERYGFTQVPIAGLSPEGEPSAAKLVEVADFVRQHHVSTIYTETLGEPAFADTISQSTGARLAVLDPLEGLTGQAAGSGGTDYFEVMRSNLTVLRAGQGCA